MSREPDVSLPPLVRATESGSFFRGPLAGALRALAVIGGLPVLGLLRVATGDDDTLAGPAGFLALAWAVAAVLAGQVLFGRAQRILRTPPARFPVVPAVRECVRALAEAAFVWSMTLSSAGLIAYVWVASQGMEDTLPTAFAGAIVLGVLGWIGLLVAHMTTELATALVEIANNTAGGMRGARAATRAAVPSDAEPATDPGSVAPAPPIVQAPPTMSSGNRSNALKGALVVTLAAAAWFATRPDDAAAPQGAGTDGTTAAAAPAGVDAGAAAAASTRGADLYNAKCAACHQPEGQGIAGVFPALAGSAVVNDPEATGLILTAVKGRTASAGGPSCVGVGQQFEDGEVAALVSFVRTSWGNTAGPVTSAHVAFLR